jgi:hypothetical protein
MLIHSHSAWPRSGDCGGSRIRTRDSCVLCLISLTNWATTSPTFDRWFFRQTIPLSLGWLILHFFYNSWKSQHKFLANSALCRTGDESSLQISGSKIRKHFRMILWDQREGRKISGNCTFIERGKEHWRYECSWDRPCRIGLKHLVDVNNYTPADCRSLKKKEVCIIS